jgi:hypothetical protein
MLSCQDCFAVCKFSCRYTRCRIQQADCNCLNQEKQQQLVQQSQRRHRQHTNAQCSIVAIAYHAEGEDSEAATANPAVVHCACSGIVSHQLRSCQNRLSISLLHRCRTKLVAYRIPMSHSVLKTRVAFAFVWHVRKLGKVAFCKRHYSTQGSRAITQPSTS